MQAEAIELAQKLEIDSNYNLDNYGKIKIAELFITAGAPQSPINIIEEISNKDCELLGSSLIAMQLLIALNQDSHHSVAESLLSRSEKYTYNNNLPRLELTLKYLALPHIAIDVYTNIASNPNYIINDSKEYIKKLKRLHEKKRAEH